MSSVLRLVDDITYWNRYSLLSFNTDMDFSSLVFQVEHDFIKTISLSWLERSDFISSATNASLINSTIPIKT